MTNGQPSDPEQRLTAARAALRALLAQVEAASGVVAPQLCASVVQFQAEIAVAKAELRAAEVAVADAPEYRETQNWAYPLVYLYDNDLTQ